MPLDSRMAFEIPTATSPEADSRVIELEPRTHIACSKRGASRAACCLDLQFERYLGALKPWQCFVQRSVSKLGAIGHMGPVRSQWHHDDGCQV